MPKLFRFTNYRGFTALSEPTAIPIGDVRKLLPVAPNVPIYAEGARTQITVGRGKDPDYYYATEGFDALSAQYEADGK